MRFLQWIKNLFTAPVYQDSLESFVASKYPKNGAEVEYWVKVYQYEQKQWHYQ